MAAKLRPAPIQRFNHTASCRCITGCQRSALLLLPHIPAKQSPRLLPPPQLIYLCRRCCSTPGLPPLRCFQLGEQLCRHITLALRRQRFCPPLLVHFCAAEHRRQLSSRCLCAGGQPLRGGGGSCLQMRLAPAQRCNRTGCVCIPVCNTAVAQYMQFAQQAAADAVPAAALKPPSPLVFPPSAASLAAASALRRSSQSITPNASSSTR